LCMPVAQEWMRLECRNEGLHRKIGFESSIADKSGPT
jgi:hypothetical protein